MKVEAKPADDVAIIGAGLTTGGATRIVGRAIMACGLPGADMQDQFDCAEAVQSLGYDNIARLLYDAAFLLGGFSPAAVRRQAAIAKRTGLWPGVDLAATAGSVEGRFSVDVALGELCSILALEPELPRVTPTDDRPATLASIPLPLAVPASSDPEGEAVDFGYVADLVGRLTTLLRVGDVERLASLLDEIDAAVSNRPPVGLSGMASEPLHVLASGVVFNQVRDFFLRNHHLCWPDTGSAALFARAARFESAGLGPYGTSVARLLHATSDIVGLIEVAAEGIGGSDSVLLDRWPIVLGAHLDEGRVRELAVELGKRGLGTALQGLLTVARRTSRRDLPLYRAIRDAAIGQAGWSVATQAQAEVIRSARGLSAEWVTLAEILASGGAEAAAAQALNEAARLAPFTAGVHARKEALAQSRFAQFHAVAGRYDADGLSQA